MRLFKSRFKRIDNFEDHFLKITPGLHINSHDKIIKIAHVHTRQMKGKSLVSTYSNQRNTYLILPTASDVLLLETLGLKD